MNAALVKLHQWLLAPIAPGRTLVWLGGSLGVALVYGYLSLRAGWGADIVQDDVRQHIFWMQRFLDPRLFPDDWIADYYQSIAPPGVTALYWFGTKLGIHPYELSKFLPLVLGIISTVYAFGLTVTMLPIPIAGFIATVMLNQNLWMQDSLTSATARAFLLPGLLAVMYYVARESLWGTWVAIALLAAFYPSYALIAAGVLGLRWIDWATWWHHLRQGQIWPVFQRDRTALCLGGLAIAVAIVLPQAIGGDPRFSPVITKALALTMPEFQPGGRTTFWEKTAWDFWFNGSRSGLKLSMSITSPLMVAGLLLPGLWLWRSHLPLLKQVRPALTVLAQVILVATGLFLAAHAVLFELYLPSRYTQHSYRLVIAIATGLALTIGLDAALRGLLRLKSSLGQWVGLMVISALAIGQLLYPQLTLSTFPWTGYERGIQTDLYEFLAAQPRDTMVAAIAREADNIPTFAARSVLTSREHSIPYHTGYYQQIKQRTLDVIRAQYSPNVADLQAVIAEYDIDFWLLDTNAFELTYPDRAWIRQFAADTPDMLQAFRQGISPAIVAKIPACTAFANPAVILLDASCLAAS